MLGRVRPFPETVLRVQTRAGTLELMSKELQPRFNQCLKCVTVTWQGKVKSNRIVPMPNHSVIMSCY